MDSTKKMLEKEIETQIANLSALSGDEKTQAVDDLAKLYRLKIEETKNNAEAVFNKEEAEKQGKFRIVGFVVEGAGIVLPLIFYSVWMRKGFKFEETGTFTSKTFQGLTKFFKPTKR